jgi:cytochrome o ubiquinol oxidase operon protein cyoD
MTQVNETGDRTEQNREERRDFRFYVWGISLGFLLTLVPFTLVYWAGIERFLLFKIIGIFALMQMIVHFRFFLHISFTEKREDLHLILFSTLLLIIMLGGTIWIMSSLALRMTIPAV